MKQLKRNGKDGLKIKYYFVVTCFQIIWLWTFQFGLQTQENMNKKILNVRLCAVQLVQFIAFPDAYSKLAHHLFYFYLVVFVPEKPYRNALHALKQKYPVTSRSLYMIFLHVSSLSIKVWWSVAGSPLCTSKRLPWFCQTATSPCSSHPEEAVRKRTQARDSHLWHWLLNTSPFLLPAIMFSGFFIITLVIKILLF